MRQNLLTGEISVTGIMFFPYMNTTFPITFCRVSNFSIQLMFSATSQPETLPGKRDNDVIERLRYPGSGLRGRVIYTYPYP
jgi:hypothetical protein